MMMMTIMVIRITMITITIILLMKYLSLAGGDEAGEEQFTSSISPTLTIMMLISPTLTMVIMIKMIMYLSNPDDHDDIIKKR